MLKEKQGNMSLSDKAVMQIKRYISTMNLTENNKLPREELLAEIIGVSRVTLRSALNVLASEGIIFRKHGRGTFVNKSYFSITASINQLLEYLEVIRLNGYEPSIDYLNTSIIHADKNLASILDIKEGEEIIKSEKLFFADKIPCIYCKDFFSTSSLKNKKNIDDIQNYKNSIFKFFSDYFNKTLTWDKILIGSATGLEISIMKKYYTENELSKKSFLTFTTEAYDQNNDIILYAEEFIDSNIIKFSSVRQRTF